MLSAWLSACAAAPAPSVRRACVLPTERPVLVAALFFGRTIADRAPLSDREWAEFAMRTVTPNFPDGFTVLDGAGQWRNPRSGHIARERTKILLVAVTETIDLPGRLSAVINAYKTQFHQQSVGLITREVCAEF